jgi:protein-S-isoprenylcysteine O-methyltransferase Ste14
LSDDRVYLIIVIVFFSYFALHSLLASLMMKQWFAGRWPQWMPFYRLVFNVLAVLFLMPLLLLMFLFPGEPVWQWTGTGFYITTALALLAVLGFFYSLRYYDLSEFWGTRQLREDNRTTHDQERFHISPFHRYVRHPWYFFALVLIWTRDLTTVHLLVYSLMTLYFIVGAQLEERKLVAYHGEVYRKYQQKVASLLPLPWKILSADEAQSLVNEYRQNKRKDCC